jgi:hypothetical protein
VGDERILRARRQVARDSESPFGDLIREALFGPLEQEIAHEQHRYNDQERNQQTELDFEG